MFVFRLLGAKSEAGPFTALIESQPLPDSRQQNPVPALSFTFPSAELRFVRFEVLEFWGRGGGPAVLGGDRYTWDIRDIHWIDCAWN